MLRVDKGEAAQLSLVVGGKTLVSRIVRDSAPEWADIRIRFTSSDNDTEVTVSVHKISEGSGKVYVDDTSLFLQDV